MQDLKSFFGEMVWLVLCVDKRNTVKLGGWILFVTAIIQVSIYIGSKLSGNELGVSLTTIFISLVAAVIITILLFWYEYQKVKRLENLPPPPHGGMQN